MTVADLIPDAEVVAVAWAKADTDVVAAIGGSRIATTLPAQPEQNFPFLRVFRVGGGRDASEAPFDEALLQWDAYALHGQYEAASRIIRTLIAKAEAARNLAIGSDAWLYGMTRSTGLRRIDEPETGWARFQTDVLLTLRGRP